MALLRVLQPVAGLAARHQVRRRVGSRVGPALLNQTTLRHALPSAKCSTNSAKPTSYIVLIQIPLLPASDLEGCVHSRATPIQADMCS